MHKYLTLQTNEYFSHYKLTNLNTSNLVNLVMGDEQIIREWPGDKLNWKGHATKQQIDAA